MLFMLTLEEFSAGDGHFHIRFVAIILKPLPSLYVEQV